MHQLALPDGRAGLHAGDAAGPLAQPKSGDAGGDRAGSDDQILVLVEIELIDHGAQQVRVDLTSGSDEAGADFDDDSHAINTFPV